MKNYLSYFQETTLSHWEGVAVSDYGKRDLNYKELAYLINGHHKVFADYGLKKGDKIAICGSNSISWASAFLATASYGLVAVPILSDFTPQSVTKLCSHSESIILFTEKRIFDGLDLSGLPVLQAVFSLENGSCLWSASNPESIVPQAIDPTEVNFVRSTLDDLAVINYTSGTTGDPKGVMLTVGNISANVEFSLAHMPVSQGDKSISILPLAHMFGLCIELLYPVCGGVHVHFLGKAPGPTTLMKAFRDVRPYILVTVPLVLEKIISKSVFPVLEKPGVNLLTHIPLLRRIVYRNVGKKLSEAFGGRLRSITVGGASLNARVEQVLRRSGMPYTVGYGMTECAPLVTYEDWRSFKIGSCGRDLEGCDEVRIDCGSGIVGEVQVKGSNVMLGYYKNEEATSAAFTPDGWLKTGDLGFLDSEGFLYLRGRNKCMILSSNGQNIYPEEIESLLNGQPEIEESLVVSRKGKLIALIVPAKDWVSDSLQTLLDRVNRMLPGYSRISSLEKMESPFEHTPKHSIKRTLYK